VIERRTLAAAILAGIGFVTTPIAFAALEREGDRDDADTTGAKPRPTAFAAVTSEQRAAVRRGLDYLVSVQDPHKGFVRPQIEGQDGRVAITALAALAMMANGAAEDRGPYAEPLGKAIRYLIRTSQTQDDKQNGYLSTPGDTKSKMHGHGYAALALAEAYGMFGTGDDAGAFSSGVLRDTLVRAVRLTERAQTSRGGWGYLPDPMGNHEGSITVCQLQALRSAKTAGISVSPLTIRRATRYLHLSQEPDGSFAYSLHERHSTYSLTAAAVSTLHARGIYDSEEVRQGMDYLDRNFAGFLRDRLWFYYGSFYAAQAMWHDADPRRFERWFAKMREEILRLQAADGSWPIQNDIEKYGPAYTTAMATLVLQLPYGYLPIFQR